MAVKEYFSGTDLEMVAHEASIMCKLSHLGTPVIFGMNISVRPYHLVMQLCAFEDKSITVRKQLRCASIRMDVKDRVHVFLQIAEVVRYLHEDVQFIHNDIKADNILLVDSVLNDRKCNVVLIDYNKATQRNFGKLTESEKVLYRGHLRLSMVAQNRIQLVTFSQLERLSVFL